MNKKEARILFRNIRKNIIVTEERKKKLSQLVLKDIRIKEAAVISVYVSIKDEADTKNIILRLLDSGKTVCVPLTISKNEMVMKKIVSLNDLSHTDSYGIPVPDENALTISPESIDVILIPGLAFSENKDRLGYGGGYYDRYLEKTKAYKIGLCYKEQITKDLPTDKLDAKMDQIIYN